MTSTHTQKKNAYVFAEAKETFNGLPACIEFRCLPQSVPPLETHISVQVQVEPCCRLDLRGSVLDMLHNSAFPSVLLKFRLSVDVAIGRRVATVVVDRPGAPRSFGPYQRSSAPAAPLRSNVFLLLMLPRHN